MKIMGFPVGSDGEELACNARVLGLILGLVRSPGEGNGNPLVWSSCNFFAATCLGFQYLQNSSKDMAQNVIYRPLSLFRDKLLLFCPI